MTSHQPTSPHVAQALLPVLQGYLFSSVAPASCRLLGFSQSILRPENLRVPHPSRLLRRVGSYAPTPQPFFSAFPLCSPRLFVIFAGHPQFFLHRSLR
jgi:hypothetical protein